LLPRAIVLIAAVAVLAIVWAPAGVIALGLAVGLLIAATAEAVLLARATVVLERPATVALPIGHEQPLMTTLTANRGPLRVIARCRWPEVLGGGFQQLRAVATPGSSTNLSFHVRGIARGAAAIEPASLACTRFGLVERLTTSGEPIAVSVLPDLSAVKRMRQQLDAHFQRGHGSRMSPRAGQGREFDRLREYIPGDDYRAIAWKASARRDRLIMRDFRLERSQDVLLCVDRGHRMAMRVPGVSGWLGRVDHAVNAAVLTAWLCNRSEDRTGLLSFAAEVDPGVPQGRGGAHLAAITSFATGVAPEYLHTDYAALAAHLRRRLRQRTLILILTTLPEHGDADDLLSAVRLLTPKHLPMVLVFRDPALEMAAEAVPGNRTELCRTLVAADLVHGRQQLVKELRQLGALVIETDPGDAGIAAVNGYLSVKRRQLL
jgi:uncharacterized protein (DUF58 family)